jgi:alpha-1,2-mannosyltransferase
MQNRFGIEFLYPIEFVHLKKRGWVEQERWPYFTILGQSIGSTVLGWEALNILTPHLFIGKTFIFNTLSNLGRRA